MGGLNKCTLGSHVFSVFYAVFAAVWYRSSAESAVFRGTGLKIPLLLLLRHRLRIELLKTSNNLKKQLPLLLFLGFLLSELLAPPPRQPACQRRPLENQVEVH